MNDEVQSIAVEELLTDSQYVLGIAKSFENSQISDFQKHHARLLKIAGELQALEVCQR